MKGHELEELNARIAPFSGCLPRSELADSDNANQKYSGSGFIFCKDYYWPFSQWNREGTKQSKTCTLEGAICTVCYCTGPIKKTV